MIKPDAPIVHSEIVPVNIPVKLAFATSQETLASADIVLLKLTDADGNVGLGEAAPFAAYTGDDVAGAMRALEQIRPHLLGKSVTDSLRIIDSNKDSFFDESVSAFVACECALLDLRARQKNIPLNQLWASVAVEYGSFTTDVTMPILQPEAIPDFLKIFSPHGFATYKIKVCGDVGKDMASIRALMAALPIGCKFFLDGNQAYDVKAAIDLVAKLIAEDLVPIFFEQPLRRGDWSGHAILTQELPIPVCLDETVQTTSDVARVVRDDVAGMINLKIMKSGVRETVHMIEYAAKSGLKMMIGGMLESEVAMNVSLHLVAAFPDKIQFLDLDTPFFLTRRITKNSPWHRASAQLRPLSGIGSGLELNL